MCQDRTAEEWLMMLGDGQVGLEWINLGVGFAGGIIAACIGAWMTFRFEKRHEVSRSKAQLRFTLFLKLQRLRDVLVAPAFMLRKGMTPDAEMLVAAERVANEAIQELKQLDDL